ncbi:MAG: hypothetical protein HY736_02580 [Verrucomicrobia bacterium]|nr:hypothetical protein [Verrucomicrobiota bacterium]
MSRNKDATNATINGETGVKLPADVLEKFYHGNAERLIPGLARREK